MNCKFLNPIWKLSAAAALLGAAMAPARAGVVLNLFYQSAYPGGSAVTNLTLDTDLNSYDVSFAQTNGLQEFPSGYGFGQNWGTWSRGFLEAPQTGQYTFWIASDDDSQFWLSTDATPANRVLVCQNSGAVSQQEFNAHDGQKSALVSLVAGQKYYFEVFHTKGATTAATEHFEVAWQLPDGSYEPIIDQKHLWAFPEGDLTGDPAATASQILTSYQGYDVPALPGSLAVDQARPVDLTVTIEAYPPGNVQWYSNNVAIPGANLASYHIPVVGLNMDGVTYSVTASNDDGTASAATTLSVTPDTTPPTLVDALDLGNPGGDVAMVFSEGIDPVTGANPANYSISGATVTGARIGSAPNTVLLQVSGLTLGGADTVTVNNVQDLAGNAVAAGSSVALESDLAAWYQLDESSGTVANDSSGNGLDGAMMNDVVPDYAGKVFRSLRFVNSASPGYVKLPAGFSDFITNGLTVALWVYPTSEGAQANWDRFIDFGNGAASDNILFARTGIGQSVNFSVYDGGAGAGVSSPDGTLLMNQWQHFVVTMDSSGNVILYRNGIEVASGNIPPPNALTRTDNYLGLSNWGTDDHYDGRMDDVRIYDRVLSPAAIQALAAGGGPDDNNPAIPNVNVAATVSATTLQGGSPGIFTITRTGDTDTDLTVSYAMSGTATNGGNYAALSGSAVIPAGTNSVQVLVTPIDYSFDDVSRTAVLTIMADASYSLEDPNSGTVTIQNNDLLPTATVASGDNPGGVASGTTIDVWFAAAVTAPTATTLANYTLNNAPGLTLTNATLLNSGFRVVLNVSGTLPTNATLSVSGVQDASGHSAPGEIPIYLRQTSVNVVANIYHQGRPSAFSWSTDLNPDTYWDTWNGGGPGPDFVGLLYPFSEDFHSIKVVLGNQYSDGGDWSSQPKVYILKNPVDSNQTAPETDPADWLEVPAKLVSPHQFQQTIDPNARATPIVFDLSNVPDSDRTGYGWAIGGVPGNGGNSFLTIADANGYAAQGDSNTLVVVQEPTNTITVTAGQLATITEEITNGVAQLSYQWQRSDDGGSSFNDISGATDIYYTISPATPSDNNAQFRVVVSTVPPVDVVTSTAAMLTVLDRTAPPTVLDATYDPTNLLIDVWFDEPVDSGSASSASYQINDPSVTLSVNTVDARSRRVVLSLNEAPTVANPTITVNNVQDIFGNAMASAQTVSVFDLNASAAQVVANQYQQGRDAAFTRSTDGLVQHDANVTTWTTYGGVDGTSDFAGLTYSQPQAFGVIKVDLGYQFVNGGDWGYQPKIFILKNPVDSNQVAPEDDPADWVEVSASLISGNVFTAVAPDAPANTVPPPNTPIAFDLSQLPLSQRVGYGWAVGGVPGNQLVDGQFVSIAELRSFGANALDVAGSLQSLNVVADQTNIDVNGLPVPIHVFANFDNATNVNVTTLAGTVVSSSDSSVARIQNGDIIPQKAGTATISAIYSNMLASAVIDVFDTNNSPSLLHRYSFDDSQGTVVADSVGSDNGAFNGVGTFTGSQLILPPGNFYPATDGTPNTTDSGYVQLPSGMISSLPGEASFEFWVVWNGGNIWQEFMSFGQGVQPGLQLGGGKYLMLCPDDNTGHLHAEWFGVNGNIVLLGPELPTDTLCHVVLTHDQDRQVDKLYLNGQLVASAATTATFASLPDTDNWLGIDQWQDPMFNGTYDEFRIWNGVLTAGQVAENYTAGPDTIVQTNGTAPTITVSASGSNLIINWPAGDTTGYTLQTTSSLNPANWSDVEVTPTEVNGQYQVVIPVLPTGSQFYRLKAASN